jgi:hypothetical protein
VRRNLEFTHSNPRVQHIIDMRLAKLVRVTARIEKAVVDGRISERDGVERIARFEQSMMNEIAHFSGQPRPKQRERQPLDDPDAGKVG